MPLIRRYSGPMPKDSWEGGAAGDSVAGMVGVRVVSVVEDDDSVRRALDSLLRSAGLRVATLASAEDFLRSDHLATTGCLILDLQLTGMDGLQLQQRLAGEGLRIPIIILTAHSDEEARIRPLGPGALAFFRRRWRVADLLALLGLPRIKGRQATAGVGARR